MLVVSTANNTVVATVSGAVTECACLAYDPLNGDIYTADNSNVYVVSTSTNHITKTIPTTGWKGGLAIDTSNGDIYLTNGNASSVQVIDGSTNTFIRNISVANFPGPITYDSGTGNLYFGDGGYGSWSNVSVLSGSTNRLIGNVSVAPYGSGNSAKYVAYDSFNGDVYASMSGGAGNLTVITGAKVVATVPFAYPSGLTYVSQYRAMLVAYGLGTGSLAMINDSTNTVVGSISGSFGSGVFDPDNGFAYVVDAQGVGVITFSSAHYSIQASLQVSRTSVDTNQLLTFNTTVAGGRAPYTYRYSVSSTTAGCAPTNAAWLNCTPAATGSFNVSVNVTDSLNGWGVATSPTVTVFPGLRATFNLSAGKLLLGQTLMLSANATGGTPPYQYSYGELPPGCLSRDNSSIGCLPTQAGSYAIKLNVTDLDGNTVTATSDLQVVFDFTVIAPSNTSVNSALTIQVQLAAPVSQPQTLTYSYLDLPPGCQSQDTPTLTCTPTQLGTFTVNVSLQNQIGNLRTHEVTIHVVSSTTPPPTHRSSTTNWSDWYYTGGAIVAAGITVSVVVYRRTGRRPPMKGQVSVGQFKGPQSGTSSEPYPILGEGEKDPLGDTF